MPVDAFLKGPHAPIFHLHLGKVALHGQIVSDFPSVIVQINGVCLGNLLMQQGLMHRIQLSGLRLQIPDKGLCGIPFHRAFKNGLPVKPAFQQLGLVIFLQRLAFNLIQRFGRRFGQVLLQRLRERLPQLVIAIFRVLSPIFRRKAAGQHHQHHHPRDNHIVFSHDCIVLTINY